MTNFEGFSIESSKPNDEGVEEVFVPKEDEVSIDRVVEQSSTPDILVEKEGVSTNIDWLKSDGETSKKLAGDDIRRENDAEIKSLGMEEIRKRTIDTSNLSPVELDSMIESLGREVLSNRNHEWSIQKQREFQELKNQHDEEVRRRTLEKDQDTFLYRVRNFLSKDIFGFLKKK